VVTQTNPPTLRSLATNYLDICSVPRRSFFELLRHFSTDMAHIEKFEEFCTTEGQQELWDYTTRPRRTIFEVVADFWSSLEIPLEYVLDVFPAMKPRRFSIASCLEVNSLCVSSVGGSQQVYPGEIHLCVAIVKYKTNLKRPRWGVCTRWLSNLREGCPPLGSMAHDLGTEMPVGIVKGSMHVPESNDIPCIFVGPGTGIAPMRALIQQRMHNHTRSPSQSPHFPCIG